jgi:hypothetical protein
MNSLLLKLITNSFIPLTKKFLNVYTFKNFLVNGINEFVINFNNNEFIYKKLYVKFLFKLNYYKKLALSFYKSYFIYYQERSKYKKYMTSKAFQIKMQKRLKFKNKKQKKYKNKKKFIKVNDKIFYHCKLWRRNFSNLLLNLSILLI